MNWRIWQQRIVFNCIWIDISLRLDLIGSQEIFMIISMINFDEIVSTSIFISWLFLLQLSIISISLLFITFYLPRKRETLQFLHRLGFIYLFLNLWLNVLDRPLRFPEIKNQSFENFFIFQEDFFLFHLFFLYGIIIVAAFFYGVLDQFFLKNGHEIEFPLLILFISIGSLLILHVHTLIEFLIAIETVTLASYVCAGYERQNAHSTYASVQYFILGSIPSGMLVLGLSLLYGNIGVLNFEDFDLFLSEYLIELKNWFFNFFYFLKEGSNSILLKIKFSDIYDIKEKDFIFQFSNNLNFFDFRNNTYLEKIEDFLSYKNSSIILAILFILFNLLFKLTAAPFHFWAPSVYKYAPVVSVTYLSIFSKVMVIFFLFKLLLTIFFSFLIIITPLFFLFSGLSIFFGLLGAFTERYVKSFFVYSSMGHVGFILVSLSLFTFSSISATFHYLFVYVISSFLMWFILVFSGRKTIFLVSFKELRKTEFIIALFFALLIFSMSGLPPLGGFFIKLDILSSLMESSRFELTFLLFLFTVANFFYYLRINKILFFDDIKDFKKIKENISTERVQLLSILFFILLFYPLFIQVPGLMIQNEVLFSLF
jgi:NADH:ubiquinone oxidoreductase subunit 2 (subunit N)